jgi:hypothetical protein
MRRALRVPLLHFLVLGAALVAVRARWEARDAPQEQPARIVLSAADVSRLEDTWRIEHGASPGPAAEAALIQDAVDEEILHREALAAGFDRLDGTVRERLVRLGTFLGERGDRDGLEREARRLGLERSDVVVRRHLVDMMRLSIGRPAPSDLPAEPELQAYLVAHADVFGRPSALRLAHVYLSDAARGAAAAGDATALLDTLRRTGAGPDAAARAGDPFIRGAEIGPAAAEELARIFGGDFARAAADAPAGVWLGPVRSTYGLHLVWVREHLPGRLPPLETVRNQVILRLLAERGAERAEQRMRVLRARYDVEVAGRPWNASLPAERK